MIRSVEVDRFTFVWINDHVRVVYSDVYALDLDEGEWELVVDLMKEETEG